MIHIENRSSLFLIILLLLANACGSPPITEETDQTIEPLKTQDHTPTSKIDLSTESKTDLKEVTLIQSKSSLSQQADKEISPEQNVQKASAKIITQDPQSDPWFDTFWSVAKQVKNKKARRAITKVLEDPQFYRFQLLITEYEKRSDKSEVLTPHIFRVDEEYFYPASAIKTYGSIAALRHYTLLKNQKSWLTTNDPMSSRARNCKSQDKSNEATGLASLEHEIKKTQLISSNKAFNTVFNVTGFRRLHEYILADFPSVRVYHRLSSRETHQECLKTPALHICNWTKTGVDHKRSYLRKVQTSPADLSDLVAQARATAPTGFKENRASLLVGKGYKDMKTKKRVAQPMDFTFKNRASFYDFQRLNMGMYVLNQDTPLGPAVKLLGTSKDSKNPPLINPTWLKELRHAMAIYPRHSKNPQYSGRSLAETRFKPLIRGIRWASKKLIDQDLYYLNKAGKALGFHMDNAFIAFGKNAGEIKKSGFPMNSPKRGLFVTVGIYVNKDGILNDDKYEYSKISVPVLNAIGYAVGRYLVGEWPKTLQADP